MKLALEQRVIRCSEAIGAAFNWVLDVSYGESDGVLQIRILHTYPEGVDIRRAVRWYLREWIPHVIPIELAVIQMVYVPESVPEMRTPEHVAMQGFIA